MSHMKGSSYPQLNFEARPKHLDSIRGRLDQFIAIADSQGGHFDEYNLSSLLYAHRLDDEAHVKLEVWSPGPPRAKPTFEDAKRQTYKPAHKGDEFGPSWTNHWFKVTIHIPKEWEEYERVQLEFDSSGEAMVFTTDGDPIHGLTGGFNGDRRVEFIIPQKDRKAGVAHYYIEASCNGMFGQDGDNKPPNPNRYYKLNSADLVVPNMDAWRLMWDFDTLRQLVDQIPLESPLHKRAEYVANEIMNVFETGSLESVRECRKVAEKVLGRDWEKEVEKESQHAHKQDGNIWGVGHCHIDTAWLWPFAVTQQKSARSWSTQVDLINRYPEHRFSATQAQQFKWVEQLYPTLFARIKEKVSEGTFQPLGATWVEMDCNMPSGEALCRQFLYGQRYYKSRFGFTAQTFVLPDTFGYASQLPQIARMAGCDNFFTQKLSWNTTNKFPFSTFNWVGLDSTQILTHMTPCESYGSQCNLDDFSKAYKNHKNMDVTSQSLLLFGNGDGGGGPTPPMLEKLRRARAVGKKHESGGLLAKLKMGGSFDEFFASVRKETFEGKELPNWRGELYAEFHRGTYTTHASIKKGNRKSEILMREAEYAATMAALADPSYKYPKEKLDDAWEDLLLCQFHDVLPGSGIAMIYEDSEVKYAALRKNITAVIEEAYAVLFKSSVAVTEDAGANGNVFAINTMPEYPRQEVVAVPTGGIKSTACCAQVSRTGKQGYVLVDATEEKSIIGVPKGLYADEKVSVTKQSSDTFVMSNATLDMKISDGRIVSIYDKVADREIIPEGMTGGMVIFEDQPNYWDAWDVDQFHLQKATHLKFGNVAIVDEGPLRATISASVRLGQSTMDCEISMDAVGASVRKDARSLIRFSAVIDWREKHKILKFELPMNIQNDNATYETQFGVVQRPTHRNTSWDNAKFEVCGHKFADLSEFGYGVAILNDCKYGYSTEGNMMRLSLLRAPTAPDADADMGTHRLQWAIYPHDGTFIESDVADVAYAFNSPMSLRSSTESNLASTPFSSASPFHLDGARNVRLETVKRGEDDSGNGISTVILRLYEHLGGKAKATLKIARSAGVKSAEIVDVLERHVEKVKVSDGDDQEIKLDFRGFEFKTLKLTLDQNRDRRSSVGSWVKVY